MTAHAPFSRSDLRILLRIVGSRKGADVSEIVAFHHAHQWPELTEEQVREVTGRLFAKGWVVEEEGKFSASPELQRAFQEACRNCRDTFEEYDVLERILHGGPRVSDR